ncbi:WLM-domain-containing protein [Phlebopus sp. FC_14]|nr:WLM-domain-containing protein [Phlebopus sp. FC_14]
MVHLRLNERESNPNPFVNFISVLPMADATAEGAAHQLLRGLAAQVKPVMKAHGFAVNSLEEYEYNRVFAGRNWNSGETIELVLRGQNGSLQRTDWLMSTLCHELAHIKHMNHGPAFQALWRQLQQEVRALRSRGYFGDGYWSSGTRLADSAMVAGQGIQIGDLPEYMCGGAHARARPFPFRRHRSRADAAGPSLHTGPQTAKKRRTGSRITNSNAFTSAGMRLNGGADDNKTIGKGFRKKAGSKRAREEHALVAEKRIQALRASTSSSRTASESEKISDSENEPDNIETDQDRRRILLETIKPDEHDMLATAKYNSANDFLFPQAGQGHCVSKKNITFTECSVEVPASTGNKRKRPHLQRPKMEQLKISFAGPDHFMAPAVVEDEMQGTWHCLACTFINEPNHLACSACSTVRGDHQ